MKHRPDNATDLTQLLELQKNAFLKSPYPSKAERKSHLNALKQLLLDNQDALCDAISQDFGYRSPSETRLVEIMTSVGDINYLTSHLGGWMKPERRAVGMQFMPASNKIMYQPLGVVGIIVPWNYPLFLAIGPLAAALAAGNRVMIKMSEFTPALNELLESLLATTFDKSHVAIVQGEADVAAAFSSLPFDHLLFTGSTNVGKHVMRAAAEHLTPVTLELGGKSPVIIDDKMNIETAAERLVYGKCVNAGQTCVAPDYILCPKDKVDALAQNIVKLFNQLYPDFDNNPDYSNIVNERQSQRLHQWLDDAENKGAKIISATKNHHNDYLKTGRKLPIQVILNTNEDMTVMQEEIFGPALPILPYDNLEQAISYVQQRPRPLALYIMSFDSQFQQQVLQNTHAGGVTINDTLLHFGQKDMPVGGVGPSGMGCYHGIEGFKTFSSAKGIHSKGRLNAVQVIHPPYAKSMLNLVLKLFVR